MSDFAKDTDVLISRQAAIEALGERPLVWDEWTDEFAIGLRNQYDHDVAAIKSLPSAQQCMTVTSNTMVSDTVKIPVMDGMTERLPSAQPEGWMERNKERILQAGMEGREIEFRIGGRLFAIREKAQ